MENALMPISDQLKAAIVAKGLTLYGAAQIIEAELNLPLKTIHRRLSVMTSQNPPLTIVHLEEMCAVLGLKITIE